MKKPNNTPLAEWSSGWLKMEVASLYDVPEYLIMTDAEKRVAQMPVGDNEMREFIAARRETDAMLANPDLIEPMPPNCEHGLRRHECGICS